MTNGLRIIVAFFGLLTAYAAIGLYFRWQIFEDIWPWKGYSNQLSPLSFFFLSSIAAAISAPLLWLAATNKFRAAAGGAVNLILTFSAAAVLMFKGFASDPTNTRLLVGALGATASVIFTAFVLFKVRRMPFHNHAPAPRIVRISFVAFVVALIAVGSALVLKVPNILPWSLTPEASVIYGWIFLGAACYFIVGLRTPLWENSTGQLLGFLAYDAVLILPFIREFSQVPDHLRLNLILYTIVVVYSGLLAIFYCFINPATRIPGVPPGATANRPA